MTYGMIAQSSALLQIMHSTEELKADLLRYESFLFPSVCIEVEMFVY